jgi:hypothetical protein
MKSDHDIKSPLNEIKRDNPFKVPDNYFETFPIQMAHKISDSGKEKDIVHLWGLLKPKLVPVLAFSGIALLLIVSVIAYQIPKKSELTVSELAELYKYTAISESSETDLIKELEKVSAPTNIQNDSISSIQDNFANEAIDYLQNENIDINSVIDAL